MIKIMFYKETLAHLSSLKFYPMTVILLALFITNALFFSGQYTEQRDYYDRNANQRTGDAINRFYHFSPSPASFCTANNEKQSSITFWVRLEELRLSQSTGEKGNIFLPSFQTIDWTFIVQYIFSLLLLLLSYNAISEERERKTLALIGSNAISRWQIFLSKFMSMAALSSSVLLVAMLSSLIVISAIGKIPISGALLIRLTVFFALAVLYGSLFIFAGLGCSIIARRSTISLLLALTLWLFFVVILPESIDILVRKTHDKPSDYELTQMYSQQEYTDMTERYDIRTKIESKKQYTEEEKLNTIEKARTTIEKIANNNSLKIQQLADYILQLHIQRYQQRQRWKKLSPTVLFRDLSEKIMSGGNYYFISYLKQVRDFSRRYQEDMFRRFGSRVDYYFGIRAEINGETVSITPDKPKYEYNQMELEFKQPGIKDSIFLAFNAIAKLLLLVIGFTIWSFIGFVRCDIR